MQVSITNISPFYGNTIYYTPSALFLPSTSYQPSFYYLDLNNTLNYQFIPQNGQFYNQHMLSNCTHFIQDAISYNPNKQGQKDLKMRTQNVEQHQTNFRQTNKRNRSIPQKVYQKCQKQSIGGISKSGNDRFIKKNTESNVVNQIFSFLWTPQKSKHFLEKILREEQQIEGFYELMRSVKSNCKSQLNRLYLRQLMDKQQWQGGLKKLKKKLKRNDKFDLESISNCIKKLVFLYLRQNSRNSIMTSKKMNTKLWKLHFSKCRQIMAYLFDRGCQ